LQQLISAQLKQKRKRANNKNEKERQHAPGIWESVDVGYVG
jgi:hypothetical protein